MESKNTCQYCKKNYSSKSALNVHIKTSKTCINLRGDLANNIYNCEYCEYTTTLNNSYIKHKEKCRHHQVKEEVKEEVRKLSSIMDTKLMDKDEEIKRLNVKLTYKNREIMSLKEEVKEYKNHVLKLSERPTTMMDQSTKTNDTYVNLAPLDLSIENITKKIQDNFTLDHISIKGVVQFLVDNLIGPVNGVPRYSCSDASRNMFKYKSIDGKINKDIKATNLIEAIKDPIRDKSIELAGPETQRLFKMSCDSQDADVSALTDIHLNDLSNGLFKVKYLGDNRTEFSKELATKTTQK